jgi:hypothetical protein
VSFEYVKNIMVSGDGNPYPGGAADYERQLRSILNTVKSTGTGKTVMGFFALRSHRAWIVPPEGLVCQVDAGAQPVDFVAAFRRGMDLRDGVDGHLDPRHRHGSGVGTDSRIHFHPIHWSNSATTFTTAEEVIIHELFHAMRQAFGALRNTPMPDFKTVEELYSIFVENMYANEKGLPLPCDGTQSGVPHADARPLRDDADDRQRARAGEQLVQSVPRLEGVQPHSPLTSRRRRLCPRLTAAAPATRTRWQAWSAPTAPATSARRPGCRSGRP